MRNGDGGPCDYGSEASQQGNVDEDEDELQRFCADAYPRLVAALSHQFNDPWLGEELTQEALVQVCARWPKVRDMANPIGWAFKVGSNIGRSRLRRRGAERRARQRHGAAPTEHADADAVDRIAVREALSLLSPTQREAVVLRFYLDLTAEEAAQILGSTPGAVRGLTFRAVRRMRDGMDVHLPIEEASDVS